MRDYPSIPNVFRVGSTFSVNNVETTDATSSTTAATATAVSSGVQQRQQPPQCKQNKLQQQNALPNNTVTATSLITTPATTRRARNENNLNCSVESNGSDDGTLTNNHKSNTSNNNMHNNHQSHRLTTTASIECNYPNGGTSMYRNQQPQPQQQHSPYATLPRTISTYAATSDGNGDGSTQKKNGNEINSVHHPIAGVINTISGSIPATGFSNARTMNGRATSVGSDLNVVNLSNSCSELNKLNNSNGNAKHHHQQQQQQQLEYNYELNRETNNVRSPYNNYAHQRYATPYKTRIDKHNNNNAAANGYLWIVTPVAASISVAIVIAALAGPQWLFTEEKLPNTNYNGTANFKVLDDGAFITKYTKSSLWILCTTIQGVETYNCIKIDYFPKEGYQPDPHDSTPAIPYTVTKSCPFFLASGIFLLISFIVFLIPTCSHQNNLYYFSAGIMFIVSGLLMLIGLIAYISILKAEIGSKLRPRSTLQPALFKVTYGQSFFLFVFGFIATEFVGLLNIFLYISLQEVGYYSQLPCFTITNFHGKIREHEKGRNNNNGHTYKSYKHTEAATTAPINGNKPRQRPRTASNTSSNLHQVHNVHLPLPPEMALDGKKLLQQLPAYACRRHPNNIDLERRFYFEKPLQTKCNLHSKNLAKSLNELYTEPAPSIGTLLPPPPPPSVIKAHGGSQTFPRQQQSSQQQQNVAKFADFPQEFPLTRSVSTTTELYATGDGAGGGNDIEHFGNIRGSATKTPSSAATATAKSTAFTDATYVDRRNRRNMATNTRPTDTERQTMNETERKNRRQVQGNITNNNKNMYIQQQIDNNGGIGVLNDDVNDENDEDDNDDEPKNGLCGLKRSNGSGRGGSSGGGGGGGGFMRRRTKDELFHEFCKRAGMRPKPKNIYYIANEDQTRREEHDMDEEEVMQMMTLKQEEQERERKRRNGDFAGHINEEQTHRRILQQQQQQTDEIRMQSFNQKQQQDDDMEEHIFLIDDNSQFLSNPFSRSQRRSSMYVEPTHLRRLNSNLSLHTLYPAPVEKFYQKSLFDLERCDSSVDIWPPSSYQDGYYTKAAYGGSQSQLHQDYNYQHHQQIQQAQQAALYQSRTLPRSFLKRYTSSQDSLGAQGSLHASSNTLHNIYSGSQNRLIMQQQQQQQLQQQQQQQQQLHHHHNRLLYNSALALHKSSEDIATGYAATQQAQQQSTAAANRQQPNTLYSINNNNNILHQSTTAPPVAAAAVQWPAAIPSSPATFPAKFQMYAPVPASTGSTMHHHHHQTHNVPATPRPALAHTLVARSSSSGVGSISSASGGGGSSSMGSHLPPPPPKFQRAYAFDEQRRPSAISGSDTAFDLDEIERERRRSHASLFSNGGNNSSMEHYDMINGTAV